ncbi:major facilitator superfamily domain-containing protein, partial [Exophiala viscosa]|uniref:major facilitator superfamily domain-containing protein n=1 Tax=Exophiala viscosa TaxID=2486360 RepID=UPI00219B5EB3
GVSLSFGVFQDYYTNTLKFSDRSSWIGVLNAGIPFLGAPLMTRLSHSTRFPLQYYIFAGWACCIVALLGSAFCHTLGSLVVTQGLLYGLGVLLSEMPTFVIFNTWFVRRRGLVYGIVFGSTDLFGVASSFAASTMLSKHGMKATFLMFAAICFVITGIAICFLKRRPSTNYSPSATVPLRYYLRPSFYLFMAANLLQSLAFYLPFIYLASYTTMLDSLTSRGAGAIVLAVANAAQIVGELTFGALSDKVNVHILVALSSLLACLSTFFLWGFADSFGLLIAFALAFGGTASGFLALWPRIGTLFGESDASMIYSFMSCGRGLGAIVSGPISTALIPDRRADQPALSAQDKFRHVILFVGVCMAISSAVGFTCLFASLWKNKRKLCMKLDCRCCIA